MADVKNLLLATAGAAGGGPVNVENVFSTFVYNGTNANNNSIVNNIDLSGEGGLVWIKSRENSRSHQLFDTERGVQKILACNLTNGESTNSTSITAFNSDGWTMNDLAEINGNEDYVSWTYRKAPKFFDIVTYTGDGSSGRLINHNLGSAPGMLIIKCTSSTGPAWPVFHRSLHSSAPQDYVCFLNSNNERSDGGNYWYNFTPTSTQFKVGGIDDVNGNGKTYVAYLFAHNNNDGGFGPDSDKDIIKCGTYTGDGQQEGPNINLGFEPQWLLFKSSSHGEDWYIVDNMRKWTVDGKADFLRPRLANAESEFDGSSTGVRLNSTGFQMSNNSNDNNGNGKEYIYVAIRRGPMAIPENSSDVFAIDTVAASNAGAPAFQSNFVTDHMIAKVPGSSGDWLSNSRLTDTKYMTTNTAAAEANSGSMLWDYNNGVWEHGSGGSYTAWMWKRAPGYFDVVGYKGDDQANRTVNHNLGVTPEMLWVKCRSDGQSTIVDHKNLSANKEIYLNATTAETTSDTFGTHTATQIKFVDGTEPKTNSNNQTYIAYLFATVAGVSKVGSYTGNGTSQTIDCGFSNGAKFVIVKQSSSTGSWFVLDTARGINSGNDNLLQLNFTSSEYTGADYIDPHSSGFIAVGDNNNMNTNGQTFIFYAVAV